MGATGKSRSVVALLALINSLFIRCHYKRGDTEFFGIFILFRAA